MYKIYGIRLGERAVDSYLLEYLSGEVGLTTIAYYFWCLEGSDGVTIVDTGGSVQEAESRGVTNIRRQEEQLAKIGVEPGFVQRVILTHLHWDHFSGGDLYENATFYVQKRDIEFFTGPMMKYDIISRFCSNIPDIVRLQGEGRVQVIDGDESVAPGLKVIWVGCHTPGSQAVVVTTAKGTAILCGDLHYLYRNIREDMPNLIQLDVPECLASFGKVKELASSQDLILPGHDPLLTSMYSTPGDGVSRVA